MYEISYDKVKNTIAIKLIEIPFGDEIKRYQEDVIDAISKAKKDFTILFDVTSSKIKPMSQADIDGAQQLQAYAASQGMQKFAFVAHNPVIKMQMSRSVKGTGISNNVFDNFEDAHKYLED